MKLILTIKREALVALIADDRALRARLRTSSRRPIDSSMLVGVTADEFDDRMASCADPHRLVATALVDEAQDLVAAAAPWALNPAGIPLPPELAPQTEPAAITQLDPSHGDAPDPPRTPPQAQALTPTTARTSPWTPSLPSQARSSQPDPTGRTPSWRLWQSNGTSCGRRSLGSRPNSLKCAHGYRPRGRAAEKTAARAETGAARHRGRQRAARRPPQMAYATLGAWSRSRLDPGSTRFIIILKGRRSMGGCYRALRADTCR